MPIQDIESLRSVFAPPQGRSLLKQLDRLDPHCQRFVELSPFVVVATADAQGNLDASPRGGAPGFVKSPDGKTLLIPDAPGNNRLDSLTNIVATGRIGLLFMIPGFDETLRVNGAVEITDEPALLELCRDERRLPKVVLRVCVAEAYLHCAKAFMRSQLWSPQSLVERSVMPSLGQMIKEQSGGDFEVETQEQMVVRYRELL